jgi:hypothetical protein
MMAFPHGRGVVGHVHGCCCCCCWLNCASDVLVDAGVAGEQRDKCCSLRADACLAVLSIQVDKHGRHMLAFAAPFLRE